jgi:hypothetical protein
MSGGPKKPNPEEPASSAAESVLRMQLKVGDRFADETGEWEDRELPRQDLRSSSSLVQKR